MTPRIAIGRYYPADSIIHRLDARIKMTLLLSWIGMAFIADSFIGLGLLLALLVFAAIASRLSPAILLKAVLPMLYLLLFPLVFNIILIQTGDLLLVIGPLNVTSDGLYRATFMTLRLFLLFATAILMMLTTTSIALCDAIASMLAPFERFGFPGFEIAMMASIAMRFIPILAETYEHIRQAHLARGSTLGNGGPAKRLKALAPILIALFAQSFRMAEELAQAMESRCYNGANRTHYHVLAISRADVAALIVTLIVALALVVIRVL